MHPTMLAALAVALLSPRTVSATVLTLDAALERARREAPAVLAARLRPEETRGRLAATSALLRDNPVLEAAGGPRLSDRGVSTDVEASLTQTFELGGRRGARMTGARAEVLRDTASAEETTRQILGQVASIFLRALAAEERLRVLRAHEAVAGELQRVADRRHEAGDIADLEANVARVAAWRASADVRAADAARTRAASELKVLLGMAATEPLEVRGDLGPPRTHELGALLAAAADRADLRALAADVRAAEAESRLGQGFQWPDLGVSVGYEREEGADIPLAGVSVSLPVFARGQEARIAGATRARRLQLELDARRRALEVEVRAAFDTYRHLVESAEDLKQHALPLLDDNDTLARRSYEAGELGLADYLVLRRESLGARIDYLDRSLEAGLAAVELEERAGVLR